MSLRRYGLSTTAIHGVPRRRPDWTPSHPPSSRAAPSPTRSGRRRKSSTPATATRPTRSRLAAKYAQLEGAEEALFCASGMGATALAHLAVLRPGEHLISSSWIYGGTRRLFDEELTRLGMQVTYADPDAPAAVAQGGAEDDPRDLRGDADQSADAGGGPGPDRPRGAGVRARAPGGRDLRQPDQLPPAGARGRRGHHQRHQVPQRPQRRGGGRGGRIGLVRRGGAAGCSRSGARRSIRTPRG